MTLRPRALLTSLIVAVPATVLLAYGADRVRARDLEYSLRSVMQSQLNEQLHERCDSDPGWFFTGPLVNRPPNGVFVPAEPDQLEPRPRGSTQPFELFGYDEQFLGSSPATPQLPRDFRLLLRWAKEPLVAPYFGPGGRGVQVAINTGWNGSRCMYLLGRMAPPPGQGRQRLLTVALIFIAVSGMALLAGVPTISRVRRLARHARESVDNGFTSIAPERLKDELSSLTFVFNDAMTELALRKTRIDDQDAALRRFVQSTDEDVARPLAELEATLARAELQGRDAAPPRGAYLKARDLRRQVDNLTAATRLRLGGAIQTSTVDLGALLREVVERHQAFAHAYGVSLSVRVPSSPVVIESDAALLDTALANILDNAVRYNQDGGRVEAAAEGSENGRFRLWVTDNGHGVSEEHFRGLTAVRRFRGDEGRNRRPDAPGLGLAVTREIADRLKLQLDLKRPGAGGFEVELSPRQS